MAIKRLYPDFFHFLEQSQVEDIWEDYRRIYLDPHQEFLNAYWESFCHFDRSQIVERVRQIKRENYGHLHSLVLMQDPSVLAEEALCRSRSLCPMDPEPDVYLFVGFFSADAKVLEIRGKSAIAVGLERFKDFRDLSLLITHEYGHCAQKLLLKDSFPAEKRPLLGHLMAEGLAILFAEALYPEVPLHRHLFITLDRLRWCEQNREMLLELAEADLTSEKLVPVFFGFGDAKAGIPPRTGYYLARQMIGRSFFHRGTKEFGGIFQVSKKSFNESREIVLKIL
jgi:hypothetical protein